MSAPRRVLVIDGADAAAESSPEMLTHVLTAARSAGVMAVIVVAADALSAVRDIALRTVGQVAEHEVVGLDDEEVDSLVVAFPQLRRLGERAQSRELLRRPAVADYLVRADAAGLLLSDADAMHEVWHSVVRRGERSDRGQPDMRERVLRQLARQQLDRGDAETVLDSLDTEAVAGLRRDGLLRAAGDQPWQQLPVFEHDVLRTYALAQTPARGRPTCRALASSGAPRWALPAARLACQAILSVSGGSTGDTLGLRFTELQKQFETLVAAGFGDRWADVPGEALLTAAATEQH